MTDDEDDELEFSLELEPGERVAIHGASERTTSSLVDAVFGLVTPEAGIIEIDGHDSRDLHLSDLRSRIAVVRDTEVLPCTISENLRAANADVTAEESWSVLRRVGLEEVVKALPDGLNTYVVMGGAPLSRAQSIELTIARALAGQPSVLVLDRTLDHLDPVERARIVERIFSERDTTFLLISEDPALQQRSDREIDLAKYKTSQGEAA